MLTNADIPRIIAIAEAPNDRVIWMLYVSWLRDKGAAQEADYLGSNWDVLRGQLTADWSHVSGVRRDARQVSDYLHTIIDHLTYFLRIKGSVAFTLDFFEAPDAPPWWGVPYAEEV